MWKARSSLQTAGSEFPNQGLNPYPCIHWTTREVSVFLFFLLSPLGSHPPGHPARGLGVLWNQVGNLEFPDSSRELTVSWPITWVVILCPLCLNYCNNCFCLRLNNTSVTSTPRKWVTLRGGSGQTMFYHLLRRVLHWAVCTSWRSGLHSTVVGILLGYLFYCGAQ